MAFHSLEFIFLFVPAVAAGFVLGSRISPIAAKVWLLVASLVFYGWSEPLALPILAASILFNYKVSLRLNPENPASGSWLKWAVAANIAWLAVFKYAAFAAGSTNLLFHTAWNVPAILVPLGISFYTVQQIMFLVDRQQGVTGRQSFLNYALFVSWFPYIVAGPITRWKDVVPQLEANGMGFRGDNLARGAALFVLGLAKKVILSGAFAPAADAGFHRPAGLGLVGAWMAVVSYAMQLYFDFSGYTDMARGVALMFHVSLPENFNDPFRSRGIIEYWQRWHMSLTAFITNYIYTPILRSGRPTFRRAMVATMITMTIAGAWHGASWGFLIFGVWHGIGLVVANWWRRRGVTLNGLLSWGLTAVFVLIGFALFRAPTVTDAWAVIHSMFAPAHLTGGTFVEMIADRQPTRLFSILAAFGLLFYPATASRVSAQARLSPRLAVALAACTFVCIILMNSRPTAGFIYRQF